MKNVWCLLALFLAVISCSAQQKRDLTEMEQFSGAKVLKSFYYQYITTWLESDWKSRHILKAELFTPELVGEMEEMDEQHYNDNVIRAIEAVEYMLESLEVKPLDKPGWYMVNYSWNEGNVESIPVKLKHWEDGKIKIDYVVPCIKWQQYGDELVNRTVNVKEAASGVDTLKTFYTRYITNVLESKDKVIETLRTESIHPDYWYEGIVETIESLGYDPIIQAQDVNGNMLESLEVKPLDSPGLYRVSWSCDGEEETTLIIKLERVEDKMMIRYIAPLYPAPSRRKAFAKESEALNKQAVELRFHNMSNQDSIAKALELLDKAIALNHQNLYAYGNKINLLKDTHRYDEALQTLDEAICFHPENHGFYLMEGAILEKLGRMDEALLHYQRGLELCEARFKKNPLLGTFLDGYLLKYSVYRKDIPNAEIIEAIPDSFQKADKEHIINLLNVSGSIQKIHAEFVK